MSTYRTLAQVSETTHARIGHFLESQYDHMPDIDSTPEDWTISYQAVLEGIVLSVAGAWPAELMLRGSDSGITLTQFEFGGLCKGKMFDADPCEASRNWIEVEVESSLPSRPPFKVRFGYNIGNFQVRGNPNGGRGFERIRQKIFFTDNILFSANLLLRNWSDSDEAEAFELMRNRARLAFVAPVVDDPDGPFRSRRGGNEQLPDITQAYKLRRDELAISKDGLQNVRNDLEPKS